MVGPKLEETTATLNKPRRLGGGQENPVRRGRIRKSSQEEGEAGCGQQGKVSLLNLEQQAQLILSITFNLN